MKMTETRKIELYKDFYGKVFGYIRGKVGDTPLAEDLAGDVFLKVYEKLDDFDESKASLSTWIFTITKNRLIDYYRVRRVHEEIPETLSDSADVEEEVLRNDMLEQLAEALETLPERERDIVILRYYSGYKLTEIAEKMGISYSYVKILHNNALKALKKLLE